MKNTNSLPLQILEILRQYPDQEHLISMPELQAILEADGFPSNRRTVYRAIETLREYNYDIRYEFHKFYSGYYLVPYFNEAEHFILSDYLNQQTTLSNQEISTIQTKLQHLASPYHSLKRRQNTHTSNQEILSNIKLILHAIKHSYQISFYYFDYTISKEKKYRKNKKRYILTPYAVTSYEGKYYCVLYSEKYQSFTNYRIDKMETIRLIDQPVETIAFNLEEHLQTAMKMYAGKAETITIKCTTDMASIILDEFGNQMIISEVKDEYFTLSLKTAITPTLLSWLLLFYDRVTVIQPAKLKEKLLTIANTVIDTY